jgi:hypothetical protein
MSSDGSLEKLRNQNTKLKTRIWKEYRNYSDELRLLKQQNRELARQLEIEEAKNADLLNNFSDKITYLKQQIKEIRDGSASPIQATSPRKSPRRIANRWSLLELEEEGKQIDLRTASVLQKCRQPIQRSPRRPPSPPALASERFIARSISRDSEYQFVPPLSTVQDVSSSSSVESPVFVKEVKKPPERPRIEFPSVPSFTARESSSSSSIPPPEKPVTRSQFKTANQPKPAVDIVTRPPPLITQPATFPLTKSESSSSDTVGVQTPTPKPVPQPKPAPQPKPVEPLKGLDFEELGSDDSSPLVVLPADLLSDDEPVKATLASSGPPSDTIPIDEPAAKVDPIPFTKVDPIPAPKLVPIPVGKVDPIPAPKVDPIQAPKVDPKSPPLSPQFSVDDLDIDGFEIVLDAPEADMAQNIDDW